MSVASAVCSGSRTAIRAAAVVILGAMKSPRVSVVTCRYIAAALVSLVLVTSCSEPHVGTDAAVDGQAKVLQLINDSGSVLPSHVELGDLDRANCYKKAAGFSVGKINAIAPEVRTIVDLPESVDPASLLPKLARHWKTNGFTVDMSRINDERYPQVSARDGDYKVVATSLAEAAGFAGSPRLTMYAVAPCLRTTATR